MATIDLDKLEHHSDGSDERVQQNCERLATFFDADEVIYNGSEDYIIRSGERFLLIGARYNKTDGGWLTVREQNSRGIPQ